MERYAVSECGEIRTRKTSKTDIFHAVAVKIKKSQILWNIIILCKFLPVEGPPYLCMIVKELKIECPFNLIPEDAPVLSVLLLPTRNHYFEISD